MSDLFRDLRESLGDFENFNSLIYQLVNGFHLA